MAAVLLTLPIVAVFALLGREYWLRLFESEGAPPRRQFVLWTCKGLSVPLLVWVITGVHLTLPLALKKKIPPSYARAIAKTKFGKYKDAEVEVIHELEKCEEDFDGWLILAGLYATHFNDLPAADRTIRDLC